MHRTPRIALCDKGSSRPANLCHGWVKPPQSRTSVAFHRIALPPAIDAQPSHGVVNATRLFKRLGVSVSASVSNQASSGEVVELPSTQQAAVKLACDCVKIQVATLSKKQDKKGFGIANSSKRLCVEIPTADDSPSSTAKFAAQLVQGLQGSFERATVVFAMDATASAAKSVLKGCTVLELRQACRASSLSGPLMIVQPQAEDVALVEQLVTEVWRGPYVLLVSPAWATLPQQYRTFADTFEVLYSLLPIAAQGLLGSSQDGAVLRVVDKLDVAKCPWQLLYMVDGKLTKVFVKDTRPSSVDIETVFYNVAAATSPMARGMAKAKEAFSGLFGKGKQ